LSYVAPRRLTSSLLFRIASLFILLLLFSYLPHGMIIWILLLLVVVILSASLVHMWFVDRSEFRVRLSRICVRVVIVVQCFVCNCLFAFCSRVRPIYILIIILLLLYRHISMEQFGYVICSGGTQYKLCTRCNFGYCVYSFSRTSNERAMQEVAKSERNLNVILRGLTASSLIPRRLE